MHRRNDVARILQQRKYSIPGNPAMSNVIDLPTTRVSDEEMQIREWEAVMSGGYGSAAHRVIEGEMLRRLSGQDSVRRATCH